MILNNQEWGAPPRNTDTSNKTKILFLHGLGGIGPLWRPIAAGLENDFHILALDQRGHGKSEVKNEELLPENFHPKNYANDIIETLEKLNFFPCITVGHSMGVRTALYSCHKKPQFFSGLVLIDLGLTGPAGGGLGDLLSNFLSLIPEDFSNKEEARHFLKTHCPDDSITQYLLAVLQKQINGHLKFPFNKKALLYTIEQAKRSASENILIDIAKEKIPCLLLRGEHSSVWSKAHFEKEKEEFKDFPHIKFEEMSDCGHGLPFEKRKEFTERLKKFILDQAL